MLWKLILEDLRLKTARACLTLLDCPNCWMGWRAGHCEDGCWGPAAAAAAAVEEAELVARAEEAQCGVAAALIGSQGAEMHVNSAAMGHVTGRCRQNEVSVEKKSEENIQNRTLTYGCF